jgi:ATP-dependent Clp protease ATP-binding subunit ClpA
MFERYTEKARRVIFFARYETSEFGSPYIGPEFLLLGILREDRYVITRWLGEGDWLTVFREEVEKYVGKGPKSATSVDLPLTHESKRILAYASDEAERLRHQHIGTEHLFLGILRESGSHAAKMLSSRGVDIQTVREAIAREGTHFDTSVGTSRSTTGTMHAVEVQIVPEKNGQPLQVHWEKRIPAMGEILSIDQDQGKSIVYQIVRVEWKVTAISIWPPHLAKVLLHVRQLREKSGDDLVAI